jgi:flagellar export protein FliJ
MRQDPLESLLRLRRHTVDEARRVLADCLRAESHAAEAVAALEATIGRETDVAADLSAGDAAVEAFAAWLRRIRPRQQAAHAAEAEAEVVTAEARAILAAARAAVSAVEDMLAKRAAERIAEARRQDQREIDEAAQRRSGPGGS